MAFSKGALWMPDYPGEYLLRFPVVDLESRELLPAGSLVTPAAMEEISSTPQAATPVPLLAHRDIGADILRFLALPPYEVIYAPPERVKRLFATMEKVKVIPEVLRCLDYFRSADFYTYRHKLVVFALATTLAQSLVDDTDTLLLEASAGPTHDFGKICVPLKVLRKTTPLTKKERLHLEHHALAGYVLLARYSGDLRGLAPRVARDHHERCNGSGYPQGIELDDRLVEIIAAADIYDALISPRPYRPTSYDNRTALEELTELAATGGLSWEVVRALIALNRRDKPDAATCAISTERRGKAPADNLYGTTIDDDVHN